VSDVKRVSRDGSAERGTGRIYQPRDPQHPDRTLQVWWIDYSVEGRRYRESSKSRKRSEAAKLLKQRLGQTPAQAAARAARVTFEDLEDAIVAAYELGGRRSIGRLKTAFGHLREPFEGWPARAITTEALKKYATERLEHAAPANVRYELAVLRRAMKGRLNPRPDFPSIGVHNARVGFFEQAEFEAVDFDHGTLRLEPTSTKAGTSTKNNQGRTFPHGDLPPLAEALKAQRAYTEEVQRKIGAVIPWVWHREDGSRIRKIDEAWRLARSPSRGGYEPHLLRYAQRIRHEPVLGDLATLDLVNDDGGKGDLPTCWRCSPELPTMGAPDHEARGHPITLSD
jgi:hypothetical protein